VNPSSSPASGPLSYARRAFLRDPKLDPSKLLTFVFCEHVSKGSLGIKKVPLVHGKGTQNTRCFIPGEHYKQAEGDGLIDFDGAETDAELKAQHGVYEPLDAHLRRVLSEYDGLESLVQALIVFPLSERGLIEKKGFLFFKSWVVTSEGKSLGEGQGEKPWEEHVERRIGEALCAAMRPLKKKTERRKQETPAQRRARLKREKSQLDTESSLSSDAAAGLHD